MNDDQVDVVPEPMVHTENPAFTALVERRGTRLCLEAEPHGVANAPCRLCLHQARRQLMGQYLGQQGQVA